MYEFCLIGSGQIIGPIDDRDGWGGERETDRQRDRETERVWEIHAVKRDMIIMMMMMMMMKCLN